MNARLFLVGGIGVAVGAALVLLLLGGDDADDFEQLKADNPAVAAALEAARERSPSSSAPGSDLPGSDRAPAARPPSGAVTINGHTLSPQEVREFAGIYGVRPIPGNYWYDPTSGLYGSVGQPSAGFMLPGHELGQLSADASRGTSGVFLNGRQLPQPEVLVFSAIWGTYIQPARYWMDGAGNVGYEGVPVAVGNLYAQAARMQGGGGGGGDNFWSTRFSAGNYNADNTSGYVSVPGHGPVGYGLD